KTLAEALQQAEEAANADKAKENPWFDGQRFSHTLVESPRGGSQLSDEQVLGVVRKWCAARLLAVDSFQPGRAQMPRLPVPVDVPERPKPVTPWPVRPRILWPLVGLAGTVALGAGTLGLLYLIGIIPPHPTPTNPEPIDKFVVNVHAPQQAIIKSSGDT